MATHKYPVPEPTAEHGWVDRTDRHERDAWLRRKGFRIHSRAKGQQPKWERDGRIYTQSQAVRLASDEEG